MKVVLCLALIALAAASPTSREDPMDALWGVMQGMQNQRPNDMARGMEDLLMLFHNGDNKEEDESHQMGMEDMLKMMMGGDNKKEESKGGIDDLWGVLAMAMENGGKSEEKSGMDMEQMMQGGMQQMMGDMAQGETDIKDLLELFGAGAMEDESSEEEEKSDSMDMMKQLMAMFGGSMDEESKSKSMEMMEKDPENIKAWLEKSFMALLQHRMEKGDWEGVMKMMRWAAEMEEKAAGKDMMSTEEAEEHFEMLFMQALEGRAMNGDWEGVAMMMMMAESWGKRDAMRAQKVEKAEEMMQAIFIGVMEHKAAMGDWKGVMSMMEGTLLATAYELLDPMQRLNEDQKKGHQAYMMLLKNAAEQKDWKRVAHLMDWGVKEAEKSAMEEMKNKVFYFGHLLLGGDPEMSEWEPMEENSREKRIGSEVQQMVAMMMMGKH